MILYVIEDYANAKERYKKGDVIEVSPAKAAWLQNDSPSAFSETKPEVKEVKAPPKDKAVKRSTTRRKAPAKKPAAKK